MITKESKELARLKEDLDDVTQTLIDICEEVSRLRELIVNRVATGYVDEITWTKDNIRTHRGVGEGDEGIPFMGE